MLFGLSHEAWEELEVTYSSDSFITLRSTISRVKVLSDFNRRLIHCCRDSCIAFTGQYASERKCPLCGLARYRNEEAGVPFKTFSYLPLIPQLQSFFQNSVSITAMQYRADYFSASGFSKPGVLRDVFDSKDYKELLREEVVIDGKRTGKKFFAGLNDIALGLSTDGFAPFKRRKHSAWPLIIFNYNLPPEK